MKKGGANIDMRHGWWQLLKENGAAPTAVKNKALIWKMLPQEKKAEYAGRWVPTAKTKTKLQVLEEKTQAKEESIKFYKGLAAAELKHAIQAYEKMGVVEGMMRCMETQGYEKPESPSSSISSSNSPTSGSPKRSGDKSSTSSSSSSDVQCDDSEAGI